jgi:hypothetical protein
MAREQISFDAEIVEVFERGGERLAKVLVHPFILEVAAEDIRDGHLGDVISMTARFEAGAGGPQPAPVSEMEGERNEARR